MCPQAGVTAVPLLPGNNTDDEKFKETESEEASGSPCGARTKIHNMACSENLPILTSTAGALGLAQNQKGTQLIAGHQMGISIHHITQNISEDSFQVKPQGLPHWCLTSSMRAVSLNFVQQLLPLRDVFHQRHVCFHYILQVHLEHENSISRRSSSSQPLPKPSLCSSSLLSAGSGGGQLPRELCSITHPLQKAAT